MLGIQGSLVRRAGLVLLFASFIGPALGAEQAIVLDASYELAVPDPFLDLGSIRAGKFKAAEIAVRNESDEVMVIVGLQSDLFSVPDPTGEIPPNGMKKIRIEIQPPEKTQTYRHWVVPWETGSARLQFRVGVRSPRSVDFNLRVEPLPDLLLLLGPELPLSSYPNQGDFVRRIILISGEPNLDFQITNVSLDTTELEVRVRKLEDGEKLHYQAHTQFLLDLMQAEDPDLNNVSVRVSIETDLSDTPKIEEMFYINIH